MGVSKRFHLPFLVHVQSCLTLDLFVIPIVSLLLILVTLHDAILRWLASLIRLQFGHYLTSARDGLVKATPDRLWFIHERVLVRYLHPLHDVLARYDILILWRQLKHFV